MMRALSLLATLALGLGAGCMHPRVAPPPPNDVRTVTVLPPKNLTGDPLTVAGDSVIERYVLRSPRVTVADVLATEAEELLRARGYHVQADADFRLALEIRRWEPDGGTHPQFVIVGVSATLAEAASGRVIWSARAPVHPIATPGTVVLGTAYEIAARKVVAELLAAWPDHVDRGAPAPLEMQ